MLELEGISEKQLVQTLYLLLILIVHRASYLQHCFLCVCCPLETMLSYSFLSYLWTFQFPYFNWGNFNKILQTVRKEKNIYLRKLGGESYWFSLLTNPLLTS